MGRIEICGGIASGKTTLTEILGEEQFYTVYERFDDNPFLKEFYSENEMDNSFETEIVFLLLHYNLIKRSPSVCNSVCDYSLLQDYGYSINNLRKEEMNQFDLLYQYILKKVGSADMVLYLKCDTKVLLERIGGRSREMEQSISEAYLKDTIATLESVLRNRLNVLTIESDRYDFRSRDRKLVVDMVIEHWRKINAEKINIERKSCIQITGNGE